MQFKTLFGISVTGLMVSTAMAAHPVITLSSESATPSLFINTNDNAKRADQKEKDLAKKRQGQQAQKEPEKKDENKSQDHSGHKKR